MDEGCQLDEGIELAHKAEIFVKFQYRLLAVDIAGEVRHKGLAGHGSVGALVHSGALADAGCGRPPRTIEENAGQVDARAGLQCGSGIVLVQRRRAQLAAADALAVDDRPINGVRRAEHGVGVGQAGGSPYNCASPSSYVKRGMPKSR